MPHYTDKLPPGEQLDAEEWIAAAFHDRPGLYIHEEDAAALGRDILLEILTRFRPDLVEE